VEQGLTLAYLPPSGGACSEAMIHLAMTDLMARRLTGEATVSWHDPTPHNETPVPGLNVG
jgi:hypothetical protein